MKRVALAVVVIAGVCLAFTEPGMAASTFDLWVNQWDYGDDQAWGLALRYAGSFRISGSVFAVVDALGGWYDVVGSDIGNFRGDVDGGVGYVFTIAETVKLFPGVGYRFLGLSNPVLEQGALESWNSTTAHGVMLFVNGSWDASESLKIYARFDWEPDLSMQEQGAKGYGIEAGVSFPLGKAGSRFGLAWRYQNFDYDAPRTAENIFSGPVLSFQTVF
jgi:hypothetical protein